MPITDTYIRRSEFGMLTSGVKNADALIKTGEGKLFWISLSDTAALALELNDSVDNSGTDKWALDLPASGYGIFLFDPPIEFLTGLYLDVSTTTCKVVVGYI